MSGSGTATTESGRDVASGGHYSAPQRAASCRPLQLPPERASAGEARHYVRDCLGALGRPDLIECGVLGVDELVANVCVHVGTPLVVAVEMREDGRVLIEVTDLSATPPVRREAGEYELGGRGLTLLDACGHWGLSPATESGCGKTVWFEPFSSLDPLTAA
jgi:anti-sigma regulatory factor (Ser/Thr protein kinase)